VLEVRACIRRDTGVLTRHYRPRPRLAWLRVDRHFDGDPCAHAFSDNAEVFEDVEALRTLIVAAVRAVGQLWTDAHADASDAEPAAFVAYELRVDFGLHPIEGQLGAVQTEREARRQAASNGSRQEPSGIGGVVLSEGWGLVEQQGGVCGLVENDAELVVVDALDPKVEAAGWFFHDDPGTLHQSCHASALSPCE